MFLTIWDPFGPIWTLLDHFRKKHQFVASQERSRVWRKHFWAKIIFVWNGPKGFKWAQKGLKWSKNTEVDHFRPFWTPLDQFGTLTSMTCLAIFVCFFGAFFGTIANFPFPLFIILTGWKISLHESWRWDNSWTKKGQVFFLPIGLEGWQQDTPVG